MTTTNTQEAHGAGDIMQDIMDVFRGAGFDVRERKEPGVGDPFEINGSLDNAAVLLETVLATPTATSTSEAVPSIPQAVRIAGAKMANTMFNLSQDADLIPRVPLRESMKAMQREWDAAIAATSTKPADWNECKRISNLPAVDDALYGFSEDPTGDNGIGVVRAVLEAIGGKAMHAQLARLQAPAGESSSSDRMLQHLLNRWHHMQTRTDLEAIFAHIDAQLARQRQGQGQLIGEISVGTSGTRRYRYHDAAFRLAPGSYQFYLGAAPQAQGEPVAWMVLDCIHLKPSSVALDREEVADHNPAHVRPLYLAPAAQADEVRDAVRYRKLRALFKYDHIAQGRNGYHFDADPIPGDDMEFDEAVDALKRTTAADNQKGGE